MYNASAMVLKWEEEDPVRVAKQLHLTEFTLKSYWTFEELTTVSLSRSAFGNNSLNNNKLLRCTI